MSRDLLLLLLGVTLIDVMAFDDDDDGDDGDSDDDDDGDGDDTDDDDSSDTKKKDDGKKKDDDKSEKKSKSETPEALKRQVRDLQKKLDQKTRSNGRLSRENKNLRLKNKGETPRDEKKEGDDDSEVAELRQTVTDLTDRLDNISSENFIEKNVIRKLQPLVAAGLEDDEADRKLNAALRLVDSEEDFDDDGNFDAKGFIEKYPYLAVEVDTKQESVRDRLLGGSGNKSKSKKNYAGDALKKFNERRDGNRKAGSTKK